MSTTTTTIAPSDNAIQQRIQQELEWDPRVDAAGIAVKVKSGIVTLTGVVDSYAKKVAACAAVHRVGGARDVADELEVRISTHAKSDLEIAQAVRSALIWDVFVPDERIKSSVSDGWVTLEGDVDRWQQREDAAHCVERLKGVRGVTNRIEVKTPAVDAARIRTSIEDALKRRAEREAKRLSVTVADGVVTLKGTVDSWAERNAIERLAYYSPGVRQLKNEIRIDSFT
jgi:osmotically-inducible protein OsmY